MAFNNDLKDDINKYVESHLTIDNYKELLSFIDDDYLKKVAKIISVLGNELNLKVIAEFVENQEVFEILKNIGIDLSQGYYIDKPKDIETLLIEKIGYLH